MSSPSWTLLPPPSPYHPSGSSQCTSPKHPVSCIEPGLACHLYMIFYMFPFPGIFLTQVLNLCPCISCISRWIVCQWVTCLFIIRMPYIILIHVTYKTCVNLVFILSVRLPVNSRLLEVMFWGNQKLYMNFLLYKWSTFQPQCCSSFNCCCSIVKLYLTLCISMDHSTPGYSVLHYLTEFAQIHVHWVNDVI